MATKKHAKPVKKGKKLGGVKPLMGLRSAKVNPIASPKSITQF
jgi:hypothetical protein